MMNRKVFQTTVSYVEEYDAKFPHAAPPKQKRNWRPGSERRRRKFRRLMTNLHKVDHGNSFGNPLLVTILQYNQEGNTHFARQRELLRRRMQRASVLRRVKMKEKMSNRTEEDGHVVINNDKSMASKKINKEKDTLNNKTTKQHYFCNVELWNLMLRALKRKSKKEGMRKRSDRKKKRARRNKRRSEINTKLIGL